MRVFRSCVAWVLLGAACGDEPGVLPQDAPPILDGPAPDESVPAGVTVTALHRGVAVAGLPVVWHDAAGAVLGQATTDATGRATYMLPAGGLATVIDDREADKIRPMTVGGIQPGDALTFALKEDRVSAPSGTMPTLQIPTYANAFNFNLNTGCQNTNTGGGTTSITTSISAACLDQAENFHVLSKAVTSGNVPLAWSLLADQPKTTLNATLPAWSETFESVTLDLDGLPANALYTSLDLSIVVGGLTRTWQSASVDGATGTVSFGAPPGIGTARSWYGEVQRFSDAGFDPELAVRAITDAAETTVSFDFATSPLPLAETVMIDVTAAPTISWTVTGAGGGTDALVLYMSNYRGQQRVEWYVSLPPDTASPFVLPAMPGDLATLAPTTGDGLFTYLMLLDVEGLTSSAVRADAPRWARWAYDGPPANAAPFRLRKSTTFRD